MAAPFRFGGSNVLPLSGEPRPTGPSSRSEVQQSTVALRFAGGGVRQTPLGPRRTRRSGSPLITTGVRLRPTQERRERKITERLLAQAEGTTFGDLFFRDPETGAPGKGRNIPVPTDVLQRLGVDTVRAGALPRPSPKVMGPVGGDTTFRGAPAPESPFGPGFGGGAPSEPEAPRGLEMPPAVTGIMRNPVALAILAAGLIGLFAARR